MPKPFQPLALGAKETCSYPCGNLAHDHYYAQSEASWILSLRIAGIRVTPIGKGK